MHLELAERVGPEQERERRGGEAEERDGGGRLDARVGDRGGRGGGERHEGERADPHRPRGHAERAIARQQRLLEDEEGGLGDGGGEHEQRVRAHAEAAALADGDDRGAGEPDRDARPHRPLAEGDGRHHGDEHRSGRYEHARGAGVDGLLAGVEQELVGGHAGQRDEDQAREVARRGPAAAGDRRDGRERDGGHRQPQHRQLGRRVVLERGADRREGRGPQHHRHRDCRPCSCHGTTVMARIIKIK